MSEHLTAISPLTAKRRFPDFRGPALFASNFIRNLSMLFQKSQKQPL